MNKLWKCNECFPHSPCIVEVKDRDGKPIYCLYKKGHMGVFNLIVQESDQDQLDNDHIAGPGNMVKEENS